MTATTHRRSPRSFNRAAAALIALAVLAAWQPAAEAQFLFTEINPTSSTLDPSDPDGATGGRVNGLAAVPGDNTVFYAASEWGGVYKSTDSGLTWFRLDSHLPVAAWDVEVHPTDDDRVYATSFFDGRVDTLAGINISADGGITWMHPPSLTPPVGQCSSTRRDEPSGFGIAVDPDNADSVWVGTNCGLAVSDDAGATWDWIDPTPVTLATNVWDVVVHDGGIVDVCGDDGHQRSIDGGLNWSTPSADLPTGLCSIAVSPDEEDVLFVAVGANIYESDDGGASWTYLGTPESRRQGRIPFVETNQRADGGGGEDLFDLWYGDVHLYRASCTSNPGGGGLRCPVAHDDIPDPYSLPTGWFGEYTRAFGGHDDVGAIVFDSEAAVDACPEVFSSDGGVYYNTSNASPACQVPAWEQPSVTPRGLWLWTMTGAQQGGDAMEDLYFGNQDNGMFGATDGGALSPTWNNTACCDIFDTAADSTQVLWTFCCGSPRATSLLLGPPGSVGSSQVNTYPADGLLRGFRYPDTIDTFGTDSYVVITRDCVGPDGIDNDGDGDVDEADEVEGGCSGVNNGDGGIYITQNLSANPIIWTELGNATEPPTGGGGACAVQAALDGGVPTFYVQVGDCDGRNTDQLWRFVGTNPAGAWSTVPSPPGGIALFEVDPNDPNRLIASTNAATPQMVLSTDGGASWDPIDELNELMDGAGDEFKIRTSIGPARFTSLAGYPQPSLMAFDPEDPNIIVAGGIDSGVFLSTDGGDDWTLITDQLDPVGSGIPLIPRPRYAYFDHEPADEVNMYIGSQGRGVWRVNFSRPPIADAGGPYNTVEGTDVVLDGSGSFDPDGGPLSYAWDLDDDGAFDDAFVVNPTFDLVGQDGVYTVTLRVTDQQGLSDTDESTVTVANVAPTVVFVSDAPVDENSPLTITGTVTDPGWLDPLTATVDWGDGGGANPLPGVLENVRPDATLSFQAVHVYGDNGTFSIEVCGFDDDTFTCFQVDAQIDNVDPTADIDASAAVVLPNGDEVILGGVGEDVDFSGRATDPGSDDLELSWDWGDGPPSPDLTTPYLVNPPLADPLPSPSIQPRDVTDDPSHAFDEACTYVVGFFSEDDDGGASPTDTVAVVIVGDADQIRSAGYWRHQMRQKGKTDFDPDELLCYLDIAGLMSLVFHEERDASTLALADDVLWVNGTSDMAEILDRQLLAVWLNFANGVWGFDTADSDADTIIDAFGPQFDTDGDTVPDTYLSQIIYAAETVRLDPTATRNELEDQKDILESLNLTGMP